MRTALNEAGYPAKADPIEIGSGNWLMLVLILTILVIYVTMVYGPIAAMTFIVGTLFVKETKDVHIYAND